MTDYYITLYFYVPYSNSQSKFPSISCTSELISQCFNEKKIQVCKNKNQGN